MRSARIAFELLGKAKDLANDLNEKVVAVSDLDMT